MKMVLNWFMDEESLLGYGFVKYNETMMLGRDEKHIYKFVKYDDGFFRFRNKYRLGNEEEMKRLSDHVNDEGLVRKLLEEKLTAQQ